MIDLLYRTLYRLAYLGMRLYWAVLRPEAHGALVAVWHGGELLLVHNSYTSYYSLPGGYVHRGESGAAAACRELAEELQLRVAPTELVPAVDLRHDWEGKRERVEIFELCPAERPALEVDHREVVEARYVSPAEALKLDLFPPIRLIVERKLAGPAR